jgi:CBS domain-containing protein
MSTKVADVMTQRPRAVTPQTPLNEVAEVMETEDVGVVPLVEGDRLVEIVTDRDIVPRASPGIAFRAADAGRRAVSDDHLVWLALALEVIFMALFVWMVLA